MKRIILSFLIAALAVAGGQAQMARGSGALRNAPKVATSSSGTVAHKIERQSRRASEAARAAAAAAAAKIKLKPSGLPIVIPDNDTDNDNDNKKQSSRVVPGTITPAVVGFKTPQAIQDEWIAADYDSIKALVNGGGSIPVRFSYFQLADYAMRNNDVIFAVACIERIHVDRLTPKLLDSVISRYPSLSPFMPTITRAVVVSAYEKMVDAKMQGVDCESARMPQGDSLLMVVGRVNPALNPLVTLSCVYDPATEVARYKEAADSVIASYYWWGPEFIDLFARHFLITLMNNGEAVAALDYFGRTPLNEFPGSHADFAIDLADCAVAEGNDSLFLAYLQQAAALDSVAAEEYMAVLYKRNWEAYLADPSQLELADRLIEAASEPANNALLLAVDLIELMNGPDEISWKWEDLSDYTPAQTNIRAAIGHVLNKGLAVDDGRSSRDAVEWCRYIKAEMLLSDPATLEEGKAMLGVLAGSDYPTMRGRAIIGLAYIAAHGIDKPKEGLKILKKQIKLLDDPAVDSETRNMWYDCMATLAIHLGKTQEADKYLRLKETTKE